MVFKKVGEAIELSANAIQDPNSVIPMIDDRILESMQKYAANLKRIAPKAEDFLYFAAVMMHAAEAALINDDGTPKLTRSGEALNAHWDTSGGTWRWICNDSTIRPFKNSNGDIFPEAELVKAHKKWKEKPLCIDHKSNSVDHTRGIIVDTYYDRNLKRVIALCALDKHNYPELAKKVSTGLSNSVSMGTGVGRAICFDCGRVARAEQDFCSHMQTKSCYGEINIDLSPIELSIVVNGADPHAKIKHIIASANAMSDYLALKQDEVSKIGQAAPADGIAKIKQDLEDAMDKLAKLESSLKESVKDTNDTAFPQTQSTVAMKPTDTAGTEFNFAPPSPLPIMSEETANKLTLLKEAFNRQLQELNKMANELSNFTKQIETGNEEKMSGKTDDLKAQGYFQGGGGLNEPTPGTAKYPKDPMQEDLRESGDKQMVGQNGFPGVGAIDGLHASPESTSEPKDELERKKLHQRADAEERAIRREAVVQKAKETLAYFQGGGDLNEPALHKVKYPVDKLQVQLREKEDKQMVGQKPFPDVGPIDGMHPSPASVETKDELKRKELLQRASLKAKFVKEAKADGSHDLGKSAWQVWEGDKLLLTATVAEITGGREALYNTVITEAFAKDLMSKVRAFGAEKAAALFKVAEAPALPPAPAGDAPEFPAMPGAQDPGKDGDPKATATEMLEKAQECVSDALETVRALEGEKSEMGDMPEAPAMAADDSSKVSTAVLHNMRKDLNTGLTIALNEVIVDLKANEQDLSTLVSMYDGAVVNDKNKDFIKTVAEETFASTKQSLNQAAELLAAFAIYARGTDVMTKNADKLAEVDTHNVEGSDLMSMIDDTNKDIEAVAQMVNDTHDSLHTMLADDLAVLDMEEAEDALEVAPDANDAIVTSDPAKAAQLAKQDPTLAIELKTASTKEDRLALRAKLASECKWNPIMQEFHPHGKATTHLDVKPSDDLAVVEDLEEKHDAMHEVAVAPVKVRKEAEEIQKLVSEGRLDPSKDLDILLANGVDPETVKYWKQFYGQMGPEGSQFASELVKEHAKAQAEEAMNQYRVKLARAYELTYDMVDRDLLPRDHAAVSKNVSELMLINDEGFESYKKVVARHAPAMDKRAARLPQVGLVGSGESFSASVESEDLATQLAAAFSHTSKRMF